MNIKGHAYRASAAALALFTLLASFGCKKSEGSSTIITTSPLPECELLSTVTDGDFVIAVYEEYAEITGYNGSSESVTVPEEYDGTALRSIGKGAFEGNRSIRTVTLPETVVNIADDAFRRCEKLEAIDMPSVKSIGPSAFKESGLRSVKLPDVLQNLGRYSFSGSRLEYIELPGSIVRSGDYVFSGCESLVSIAFDEGFYEISNRMFSGCTSLTEVVLPEGIETVGEYAFAYCSAMTAITVPAEAAIKDGAFYGDGNITIRSAKGSSAEAYAERYKVAFEAVK